MAKIMIEVFGDLLCKELAKGNDGAKALPSPEQLKRKILIKGKALPSSGQETVAEEEDEDEDVEDQLDPSQVPEDMKQEVEKAKSEKKAERKAKVAQELSDITIYCKAAHFKSFEDSKQKGRANQVSLFLFLSPLVFLCANPFAFVPG